MENPIDNPRNPHATLQEDVEDFVRDLAYGVVRLDWGFYQIQFRGVLPEWISPQIDRDISNNKEKVKFKNKWLENPPNLEILIAYGYLVDGSYLLTSKAFDLLDKPFKRIRVFISYKHDQSSAFALLLEARLRLNGVRADHIFIDKSLELGKPWEESLKNEVTNCDYFVVFIGPRTLEGPTYVLKEIEWALESEKRIITICHSGATPKILPNSLKKLHVFEIKGESGLDYEQGINHVLGKLRFTTY